MNGSAKARLSVFAGIILVLAAGALWAPYNPIEQHRDISNSPPSALHWFGTDDYGRDVFSRFLAGASWSVLSGVAATVVGLFLGWAAGGLVGFKGGKIDALFLRLGDLTLSLPWLYVVIGLRAILPLDLKPRAVLATMLLLLAFVSWARPARLVRGMVLNLSERGYVEAARAFGVPEWRIFVRHIFPGTLGVLAAQALVLFPRFVLAEVTLSFFGLGVSEPEPSWGAFIIALKQAYLLREQWWRLLPVLSMLPLFLSCAFAVRAVANAYRASR
ncbi:MAG: ABC transporter permease [Bryobacterales bacterium]|nr:ABC transporter permease [Bryobacterales bacterium]MBV9396753.1 ABC transporter permease [Bryobacterales bacterium]